MTLRPVVQRRIPRLAKPAVGPTGWTYIGCRTVIAVTSAGLDTVRMAISAHNCYVITRENLQPAFLALVLASAASHFVNMAVGTLHMPRSTQTSPRLRWKGRDDANRSNCSDQSRNEFPSRHIHIALFLLVRYCLSS
jgi:hypothetical protein